MKVAVPDALVFSGPQIRHGHGVLTYAKHTPNWLCPAFEFVLVWFEGWY